jgi:hypothetical protein
MSTYPPILGNAVQPKQHRKHHRLNQIYGTPQVALTTKQQPRKPKGPNMFKRMIKGLVTWSMSDRHDREDIPMSEETSRISATGIRFEVYRANGGTVVETRRQDRRSGDSIYELHVISGEQDVGAEIGKIITMEALKA